MSVNVMPCVAPSVESLAPVGEGWTHPCDVAIADTKVLSDFGDGQTDREEVYTVLVEPPPTKQRDRA
jgi:hypothetical protein